MTPAVSAPEAPPNLQREVLRALWRSVWRFRGRTLAALGLLIVSKLALVAVPWVLKRIIDTLGGSPVPTASTPAFPLMLPVFLLLGYALLRFAGTLFGELRDLVFARVTSQTVADFTLRAFEHLHRLGPRFHVQRQTGGLIRDVERGTVGIGFLLGVALFTLLPTLVEIAAVMAVMIASYAGAFALIIGVTFVAYVIVTGLLMRRRATLQRQLNELDSGANTRLVDSLLNYETVKANANERFEAQRLEAILRDWVGIGIRNQGALSLMHISQSGVIACGVGAVMLYAGQGVMLGRLTTGDLVMINAYVIQVCLPLNALGFVFRQARDALINTEQLFRVLQRPPDIDERPELPDLKVGAGEVRFEHIDFGYEPSRQVLYDADFRIAPGGTVAVVGGSGSGKSTLARLLLRFYEPTAGRVLVDGQDIRTVTQRSLRQAIGVVPQDTILFNDTIAYNIAYGRTGASLAEVIEAAKSAHVHEFIANLPEQYETRVGERGLKLSGGEKQRIAMARAILKNPPILVFDEATSALDTRSERAIQQELERLARDRTTLVIAHRLSTVVDADEILVLEHGRIVERGRHDELLSRNGVYTQMWSLQQQQSELEQAEERLALQPINLEALAAGIVDGLRAAIEDKNLMLYTTTGTETARVTGDPSRLQQLLWDLCADAVRATPPGGRIELRVERAGPMACVTVADTREAVTGPPAPPPPASPPPDPQQIRAIVEQHHGQYELSRGGGGLRHVIQLPLRAVADDAVEPAQAEASGLPRQSLAGLRVMTIDDQAEAREALVAVLEAHGARVQALESGQAALQQLALQPRELWPQLLICDIALGEEDGYEVLRRLRALEAQRHTRLQDRIPAIALTGYARAEDRMRSLLAGFQIHLAKPVEPQELVTTVAALALPAAA